MLGWPPGAGLAPVTEESSSQFGGWSIAALAYPSDQGMPVLSGFQPLSEAHARWPQVAQLWGFREWCPQAVSLLALLRSAWGVCAQSGTPSWVADAASPVSSLPVGVAAVTVLGEPHRNLEGLWKFSWWCDIVPTWEKWFLGCVNASCRLWEAAGRTARRNSSHSAQGISLSLRKNVAKADNPISLWDMRKNCHMACTAQREVETWQMSPSDSGAINLWRALQEPLFEPPHFRSMLLNIQTLGVFLLSFCYWFLQNSTVVRVHTL